MGKKSVQSDSEETDPAGDSSSVEGTKKKRFSILKYTKKYGKKKKCKVHCRSEIEEPELEQMRSPSSMYSAGGHRLRGILKNSGREQDVSMSEEDEESDHYTLAPEPRCLVGSVPRPAGAKPGRGGGVCLVIRRDTGVRTTFP